MNETSISSILFFKLAAFYHLRVKLDNFVPKFYPNARDNLQYWS